MTRRVTAISVMVVAMGISVWVLWGQRDSVANPGATVTRLDVDTGYPTTIPLTQDHILTLDADGATRELSVTLQEDYAECTVEFVRRGETLKRSATIHVYELRSTVEEFPYSWVVWSMSPLGGFELFSVKSKENYLAWVEGFDLRIAEVSQARDIDAAMACWLAGMPGARVVHVPVRGIVPEVALWGVDAFNADITILSVAKDEAGHWAIEIASPEGEKFTIIGDGENWELE